MKRLLPSIAICFGLIGAAFAQEGGSYVPGSGSATITANSSPTSGFTANQFIYSDGAKTQPATIGSGLSFSAGVLSSTGGSGGNPGPYTIGTAITASGTIAAVNTFYCVNPAAAVALTLPAAPATGAAVDLKDCTGAMSGTVTAAITPAAGNIDGAANFVMNTPYQENVFVYSGSQWSVK